MIKNRGNYIEITGELITENKYLQLRDELDLFPGMEKPISRRGLSKYDTALLEEEIKKRKEAEAKKQIKWEEERKYDEWLARPDCHFVGKAYGPQHVNEVVITSQQVRGNMSHSYEYKVKIPKDIEIYFHNAWTSEIQHEFNELIQNISEYFIETRVAQHPIVISELIMMAKPNCPETSKMYKEWYKSAMKKLSEFPTEDLKASLPKGERPYGRSKEALVAGAIKYKEEHKIKDKTKRTLSKEYKSVIAINKLESSGKKGMK